LGVGVLLFFSFEAISNALWGSLETPRLRTAGPDAKYDAVILLGGLTDERAEATWGQRAINNNGERLLETYDLLRKGVAANAILSSGSAPLTRPALVEATVLRDQLVAWGISADRLFVEGRSRNTHENAVLSAEIVRAHGWQKVLVVTSAFHMPRAAGCFRREGLAVDTLPVDYRSFSREFTPDLFPRAEYLEESSAAIREWSGRAVYRLRGYSE
jgi:uncharacterized SAM-binding protein YcdF (DUF218 family)